MILPLYSADTPLPTTTQEMRTEKPATPPARRGEPVYPVPNLLDEEAGPEGNGLGSFFTEMLNMFFVLGFIVAAMFLVAWVLKKMLNTRLQQMNTTSTIKVLERRSLSPKSAIYLLDVHGKGIVIAETPNGITSLAEIPLPPEVKEEEAKSFGKILDDKMK